MNPIVLVLFTLTPAVQILWCRGEESPKSFKGMTDDGNTTKGEAAGVSTNDIQRHYFHIVGGNPAALMIMRTVVIMGIGDKLRNIP